MRPRARVAARESFRSVKYSVKQSTVDKYGCQPARPRERTGHPERSEGSGPRPAETEPGVGGRRCAAPFIACGSFGSPHTAVSDDARNHIRHTSFAYRARFCDAARVTVGASALRANARHDNRSVRPSGFRDGQHSQRAARRRARHRRGHDSLRYDDRRGRYRIDSIPPGPHRVVVTHPLLDTVGLQMRTPAYPFAAARRTNWISRFRPRKRSRPRSATRRSEHSGQRRWSASSKTLTPTAPPSARKSSSCYTVTDIIGRKRRSCDRSWRTPLACTASADCPAT